MSETNFSEDGKIDSFTVATTGIYEITAVGATGGGFAPGYEGGDGAEVAGSFLLNADDVIEILVGGAGIQDGTAGAGAGGGGSFVFDETTNTLLEAAGGGGGASGGSGGSGSAGGSGGPGLATTAGGDGGGYYNDSGFNPGGAGGTAGSGGDTGSLNGTSGSNSSGGGGGFSGDGQNGSNGGGGASFQTGGAGGSGQVPNSAVGSPGQGGFGGGGGASETGGGGGGGGGYSGGGSGIDNIGGGGGSYVDAAATAVSEEAGENSSGDGSVEIESPACFCAGTRIRTVSGDVAVEELRSGDLLVTRSGASRALKWIGRRSYAGWLVAGNPKVLPIHFKPGSLADKIPERDLFVSPEHAMYLDNALVPAGLLVNDVSIVKTPIVDEVHYFHLELDDHDVIFAEGAMAETFVDDDSRGMFHNASEFWALHPDEARRPARYCAPRVEEGFELEALRRRLAGRAKWLREDGAGRPAILDGQLDVVRHDQIEGWARDPAAPDQPVALRVFANGAEIGRVVADRYRSDLAQAGIGQGYHAFCLKVPGGLAADTRHAIEVMRADDDARLRHSSVILQPINGVEADTVARGPIALGALRGNLDAVGRFRISGWAQDAADHERAVGLLVTANGVVIGRALANRYRGDLAESRIGSGRHAFELVLPTALSATTWQEIRIVREADGTELPGSPTTLPAAGEADAGFEQTLGGILDRLASEADERHALALLTREMDGLLARRAAREGGGAEREALRLYRRRWGNAVADAATHDAAPGGMRRALVVDRQVPRVTRDAGSVAIVSHIRALRSLGYAVSFVAADEMRAEAALKQFAAEESIATHGAPFYSCVEDVLCRQTGMFDLVYLHRIENADRYLSLVRSHSPRARIVYSVADLHHLRTNRQAQVEGRPELLARGRHLAAIEISAARRSDLVLTHSSVEAATLRRSTGYGKVHVVPFASPPRLACRPFAERNGVVVLGSFGHTPNPDAVHHLIRDILPLVWARDPTIICRIVGHGWDASRLPGVDSRVEVLGSVADLDAVLGRARLSVAPLRFGAGLKGKVLDSLAAGLPCVMTSIAAEGLELTGPLAELVGEDAAALAALILWLHADRVANERIGGLGQRMMVENFSQERVNALLGDALGETQLAQVAV